ncbi:nucleoside triphosphate pyrophosphohydrolase [Paenarthrobacter sp. YJN-5]|uniref:nucleoside triphosphate pyrophosphohydrolase n=1 Tax=Paenarthrobacter sp. YJN-5 TaxID=2735316 RepID=UPI00187852F5|nr:nucleoside triphosphate pyrophosphohydrolase [Paenarthrobacter sp. YJN-5]QOT19392.1 nucleoside triphosphate pyrophosphohydrolase [Paenarthrobacter sp. YJN-5]
MNGTVIHRKLVRDLIPDIVTAKGGTAVTRVMEPDEYRAALHTKLAEEAEELLAAAPGEKLGELADLLEVLQALATVAGHTLDEVIGAAAAKSAKRGGFGGRIWLEETQD